MLFRSPQRAEAAGKRLAAGLRATPGVVEVRGRGLLLAAELGPDGDAKAVQNACLAHGLVVNAVTATALRLAPPLLVTDAEIDAAVARLAAAITSVEVP